MDSGYQENYENQSYGQQQNLEGIVSDEQNYFGKIKKKLHSNT
jgi:hypothetical protein